MGQLGARAFTQDPNGPAGPPGPPGPPGTPGAPGPSASFTYREGGVTAGSVYATFALAHAAASATGVDATIFVDDSLGVPHVTPGSYAMSLITLAASELRDESQATVLSFDDGAHLVGLSYVTRTLKLRATGTTPVMTIPVGPKQTLVLDLGVRISNAPGSSPFFSIPAGVEFDCILSFGTAIKNEAPGAQVFDVAAGALLVVSFSVLTELDPDVITGPAGASVVFFLVAESVTFSTTQPALAAGPFVISQTFAQELSYSDTAPVLVPAPLYASGASVQEAIDALKALAFRAPPLIFRPGVASSAPVYATWAEIKIAVAAMVVPPVVLVDSSFAAAVILAGDGATDMKNGVLRAYNIDAAIQVQDGASLQNLSAIEGIDSDNLFTFAYDCTTTPAIAFTGNGNYALSLRNIASTPNAGNQTVISVGVADALTVEIDSSSFSPSFIDNSGILVVDARGRGGSIQALIIPDDFVTGAVGGASYTLAYDTTIFGGGTATGPIPTVSTFAGTYSLVGILQPFAIPTGSGTPVTASRDALPGEVFHGDCSGGSIVAVLPDITKVVNGTPIFVKCVALSAVFDVTVNTNGPETIDGAASFVLAPTLVKSWAIFIADVPGANWDVLFSA